MKEVQRSTNTKIDRAKQRITPQETTPIGKGERLWGAVQFLQLVDPTVREETRQRLVGDIVGNVIKTKDVMTLLNQEKLNCEWGIISFDKLAEWALANGYESVSQLKEEYELLPLGGSECTVEIACDPSRQDLIDAFIQNGIAGLADTLREQGEIIATDTPAIAEYFFDRAILFELAGSLEALPKSFAPIIIGIVESGTSLVEEKWKRLADESQQAILLRSQLMLVIKKNMQEKENYAN